jgi:glycosyltransferase involved in cell wall biosynthesis
MKIMLIADGRSPITRRWVQGLAALKHTVTLISTFPCRALDKVENTYVLPVAFSGLAGSQVTGTNRNPSVKSTINKNSARQIVSQFRTFSQAARSILGPLTLPYYARPLNQLVEKHKPDLVHALRIPYEGMLASYIPPGVPLAVSIWGNDLTLHAPSSSLMSRLTTKTLRRANGLIADVQRDLRLSRQWGFAPDLPTLVALTSGGIDLVEMHQIRDTHPNSLQDLLPPNIPLVVNPRGIRPGYVRNDVFFDAIPLLLERWKQVWFVCPSMAGQPEALRWVKRHHLADHVRLLPYLSQAQLWELFLRAQVSVSLTTHDGTPNTLLESMALGCFPIVGDIESLREWIVPGVNGLLVQPDKAQTLAEALHLALERAPLRAHAAEINQQLIRERAEVNLVRSQVQVFYQRVQTNN